MITILQRGGHKDHEVLLRAASFFLAQRMSTRMVNLLAIRIELRATKLARNILAEVNLPKNGSEPSRAFTIVIDRDIPLLDQVRSLAHEIVHVEQGATGKLQYRIWKSDGKLHARWDGQEMGVREQTPYRERPWEIEAKGLEALMAKAFWDNELDRWGKK